MSLNFGTSGIRGKVEEFTADECSRYVRAFIKYLDAQGTSRNKVLLAMDLRDSSPHIKSLIAAPLHEFGIEVLDAGIIPTPALAWACQELKSPGIMITGSHIPADRNGFKFYLAEGEILKAEEQKIFENYKLEPASASLDAGASASEGEKNTGNTSTPPAITNKPYDARASYVKRYTTAYGPESLKGMRVGFYEHSSAGRDIIPEILRAVGAEVLAFDRSETFIPVDTEAVDSVQSLQSFLKKNNLHAVVSTDGDADRPLFLADDGKVVPGEILGLLTARAFGMDAAVFPISCSTLIEKSNWIPNSFRTQIGSPFVLGELYNVKSQMPEAKIAGFEANGGYIHFSNTQHLAPLRTRDSVLPILATLELAKSEGHMKVSQLLAPLPNRVNQSGLIKDFAREKSKLVLERVEFIIKQRKGFPSLDAQGNIVDVNTLDGLRMTFANQSILHLRPSGNAPEFRIYVEAGSENEAAQIMSTTKAWCLS